MFYWVLRDGIYYFRDMSEIGPRCTLNRDEAHRFETVAEAVNHVAHRFPLMSLEPVEMWDEDHHAVQHQED